jgi:hypothetical protein
VSRNKIKANTAVFNKLRAKAGVRVIPDVRRYVATETDEDREWLTDGLITKEVRFDPVNRVLRIEKGALVCFVLVNFSTAEKLPDGLQLMEMNSGLFTALAADCDITLPVLDEFELHERVFTPQPEGYTGHSWNTLSPFFYPLVILEVIGGGPFDTDSGLEQFALWLAVSAAEIRTLDFGERTLEVCGELALDQKSAVPFLLMAHAMVSVRWEHAFLDVYRCIERLLSIPTMMDLKGNLGVSTTAVVLSAMLESITGWRKPEESGLISLLGHCDVTCRPFHARLIQFVPDLHREYSINVVGTYIYKLRNSIVHYRPATELPNLQEEAWKLILDFMVESVAGIYAKFGRELQFPSAATKCAAAG